MPNRLPNEPCECCGRGAESHAVNCKHYIEMQKCWAERANTLISSKWYEPTAADVDNTINNLLEIHEKARALGMH